MDEHRLTVPRTARYFTLGPTRGAREVWFVLHGYGQLAAYFLRHFRAIDDGSRLIVAPEALSRFYLAGHERVGASWMTKEDREVEIQDYLAYLDALYEHIFEEADREAASVHVMGFSQGGATASRWAVLGQSRFDRLLLWEGELAHDLDLAAHADALRRLQLTFIVGTEDEFITPDRLVAQERALIAHSIPYRLRPFDGGHRLDADMLKVLTGAAIARVVH